MAFNKMPIIAAMARPVKVMIVPAILKVSPEEKPSPHTKMVAAIIKFLDLVKSTLFSTTLRTPMAAPYISG